MIQQCKKLFLINSDPPFPAYPTDAESSAELEQGVTVNKAAAPSTDSTKEHASGKEEERGRAWQ